MPERFFILEQHSAGEVNEIARIPMGTSGDVVTQTDENGSVHICVVPVGEETVLYSEAEPGVVTPNSTAGGGGPAPGTPEAEALEKEIAAAAKQKDPKPEKPKDE